MKTLTWVLGFSVLVLLLILAFGTYVPDLVKPEQRDANGYTEADYDAAYREIGYNFTKAVTAFEDQCRDGGEELAAVIFMFHDGDIVMGKGRCTGGPSLDAMAKPGTGGGAAP